MQESDAWMHTYTHTGRNEDIYFGLKFREKYFSRLDTRYAVRGEFKRKKKAKNKTQKLLIIKITL